LIKAFKFRLLHDSTASASEASADASRPADESASAEYAIPDTPSSQLSSSSAETAATRDLRRRGSLVEICSVVKNEATIVESHLKQAQEVIDKLSTLLLNASQLEAGVENVFRTLSDIQRQLLAYATSRGIDLESLSQPDSLTNTEPDSYYLDPIEITPLGDETGSPSPIRVPRFVAILYDALKALDGTSTYVFDPLAPSSLFLSEFTIEQAIELGHLLSNNTKEVGMRLQQSEAELFKKVETLLGIKEELERPGTPVRSSSESPSALTFMDASLEVFRHMTQFWEHVVGLCELFVRSMQLSVRSFLSYFVLQGWSREMRSMQVKDVERLSGWNLAKKLVEGMQVSVMDEEQQCVKLVSNEQVVLLDDDILRTLDTLDALVPKRYVASAYHDTEALSADISEVLTALKCEVELIMKRRNVLHQSIQDLHAHRVVTQELLSRVEGGPQEDQSSILFTTVKQSDLSAQDSEKLGMELDPNHLPVIHGYQANPQSHSESRRISQISGISSDGNISTDDGVSKVSDASAQFGLSSTATLQALCTSPAKPEPVGRMLSTEAPSLGARAAEAGTTTTATAATPGLRKRRPHSIGEFPQEEILDLLRAVRSRVVPEEPASLNGHAASPGTALTVPTITTVTLTNTTNTSSIKPDDSGSNQNVSTTDADVSGSLAESSRRATSKVQPLTALDGEGDRLLEQSAGARSRITIVEESPEEGQAYPTEDQAEEGANEVDGETVRIPSGYAGDALREVPADADLPQATPIQALTTESTASPHARELVFGLNIEDAESLVAAQNAQRAAEDAALAIAEKLEVARVELQELVSTRTKVGQELIDLATENASLLQERNRLKLETQELTEKASQLLADMQAVLRERDEAMHVRDVILTQKAELEADLAKLAEGVRTRMEEYKNAELDLSEVETAIQRAVETRDSLTANCDQLRARIQEAKAEQERYEREASKAHLDHLQLLEKCDGLRAQIAVLEQQRDATLRKKEEELRRELEEERVAIKAEARANGQLQGRNEMQALIAQAAEEKQQAIREKTQAEQIRAAAERERAEADRLRSEMERKLEQAERTRAQAESALNQARMEAQRIIQAAESERTSMRLQAESDMHRATRAREDAEAMHRRAIAERDAMLEEARKQAAALVEQGRQDALAATSSIRDKAEVILADAKRQVEEEVAKGRATGERERLKVLEEAERERDELLTIARAQAAEWHIDAESKNAEAVRIKAEAQQLYLAAETELKRARETIQSERDQQRTELEAAEKALSLRSQRMLEAANVRAQEIEALAKARIEEQNRIASEARMAAQEALEKELAERRAAWLQEQSELKAALLELEKDAKRALEAAQEQAESIIRGAETEAQRIKEETERLRAEELSEERLQIDRELRELRISLGRLKFEEETCLARTQRAQNELALLEKRLEEGRVAEEAHARAVAENTRVVTALEARAEFLRKAIAEREQMRDSLTKSYEKLQEQVEQARMNRDQALDELREAQAQARIAHEEVNAAKIRLAEAHDEARQAAELSRKVVEEARKAAEDEANIAARGVKHAVDALKVEQYELVKSVAVQRELAERLTKRNAEVSRALQEKEERLKQLCAEIELKERHPLYAKPMYGAGPTSTSHPSAQYTEPTKFKSTLGELYSSAPEALNQPDHPLYSRDLASGQSIWGRPARKIGFPPPMPMPAHTTSVEQSRQQQQQQQPMETTQYYQGATHAPELLHYRLQRNGSAEADSCTADRRGDDSAPEIPSTALRERSPALANLEKLYEKINRQSQLLNALEERDRNAYSVALSPAKQKTAATTTAGSTYPVTLSASVSSLTTSRFDPRRSDGGRLQENQITDDPELARALASSRSGPGNVFGLNASISSQQPQSQQHRYGLDASIPKR